MDHLQGGNGGWKRQRIVNGLNTPQRGISNGIVGTMPIGVPISSRFKSRSGNLAASSSADSPEPSSSPEASSTVYLGPSRPENTNNRSSRPRNSPINRPDSPRLIAEGERLSPEEPTPTRPPRPTPPPTPSPPAWVGNGCSTLAKSTNAPTPPTSASVRRQRQPPVPVTTAPAPATKGPKLSEFCSFIPTLIDRIRSIPHPDTTSENQNNHHTQDHPQRLAKPLTEATICPPYRRARTPPTYTPGGPIV